VRGARPPAARFDAAVGGDEAAEATLIALSGDSNDAIATAALEVRSK